MADLTRTIDARVMVSWDGDTAFDGAYDDITADVLADSGVTIELGKDGARTLSPPRVSACDFTVENHTGTYSQERADSPVYQNVVPMRPVKIAGRHGATSAYDATEAYDSSTYYDGIASFALARTQIDTISQTTGWGQQAVALGTIGVENALVAARVTIGVMVGPRIDQCITAILDAVSWPADHRVIAVADTMLAYWWCDDRAPWDALTELLRSEGPGAIYVVPSDVDGEAVFHFENRGYRTTTERATTSQAAFVDQGIGPPRVYDLPTEYDKPTYYDGRSQGLYFTQLSYEPGFRDLFNRATYLTRTRTLGALGVVWTYGQTIGPLSSGQSVTLIAHPNDPFQSAVTPVSPTDYTVSGGTVTVTLAASSGLVAFITVTQASGTPTVSGLQLRAQPLTVLGETTVANVVDASVSIARFSPIAGQSIPIVLDVSGWPEISAAYAVAVCDAWVTRYMVPRPLVTVELRNGDAAHMAQILYRQMSDRISLVERNTGLSSDVWINAKHLTITAPNGTDVRATLLCEKCEDLSGYVWDASTTLWDNATWGT